MLKKIVNIRLSAANWLILSFLTVLATACSISYKFNGASIDYTKVKIPRTKLPTDPCAPHLRRI